MADNAMEAQTRIQALVGKRIADRFTVTPDMRPAFAGETLHPVLGTVHVVYTMEWAARRLLLPVVDHAFEGIGIGVNVRHKHPAAVGAEIDVEGVCSHAEGSILRCEVTLSVSGRTVAEGSVWQALLPREDLEQRFLSAAVPPSSPTTAQSYSKVKACEDE